jgi:hypothetical protein
LSNLFEVFLSVHVEDSWLSFIGLHQDITPTVYAFIMQYQPCVYILYQQNMKIVIMITFDRHGMGTFSHWLLEWLDKRDKTKINIIHYVWFSMVVHYVVVRILTNNICGNVPVGMCVIPSPYKYDATSEVDKSQVLGHPVD